MPDGSDSRRTSAAASSSSPQDGYRLLSLDLVEEAPLWAAVPDIADLVRAAGDALAAHSEFRGKEAAEACIALSDNAAVQDLNARFRGKNKPTNVLSFPAPEVQLALRGEVVPLGDVVLAYETVLEEARAQGIPLSHHIQHLVVHGILHLMGFDHETESEAHVMEGLEIEILAGLGIANPYAEENAETNR